MPPVRRQANGSLTSFFKPAPRDAQSPFSSDHHAQAFLDDGKRVAQQPVLLPTTVQPPEAADTAATSPSPEVAATPPSPAAAADGSTPHSYYSTHDLDGNHEQPSEHLASLDDLFILDRGLPKMKALKAVVPLLTNPTHLFSATCFSVPATIPGNTTIKCSPFAGTWGLP